MNLILGTANFCNDYGKRLERDECFKILDTAKRLGMFALDTAQAYGGSEQVIKDWLDHGNHMTVFSKRTSTTKNLIGDYVLSHDESEIGKGFDRQYDGFSIYSPAKSGWIHGWIQAPFNPLNYTFKYYAHNDHFIARSIFLGGKVYGKADREAIAKLTFGFLRSHGISNCVFGVESVEELEINVRIARDETIYDTRTLSRS